MHNIYTILEFNHWMNLNLINKNLSFKDITLPIKLQKIYHKQILTKNNLKITPKKWKQFLCYYANTINCSIKEFTSI